MLIQEKAFVDTLSVIVKSSRISVLISTADCCRAAACPHTDISIQTKLSSSLATDGGNLGGAASPLPIALALSCCCCGGLHSVLGDKRCVRTVCTVFALFCTVFALYLHRCFVRCSSCPISTLHCAGWAGLGWAGLGSVSCVTARAASAQGRHGGGRHGGTCPYTALYTCQAVLCGKKEGMSMQQMITFRVFPMPCAMPWMA